MNPVWILLLATFASAQYNGIFDGCGTDLTVSPLDRDYGSLNGFYSIAKGISDGLQKKLPQEAIQDIYNYITGVNGNDLGEIVNDVVKSQAGAIAFFCVGLLIILVSLVLGFVTCCCRNYCSGCGASGEQDADASKVPLILIFVLLLASFAFIITGIIIFNQSASNMFNVVDDSANLIRGVVDKLNTTLVQGTAQITCAINASVDTTFTQAEANMAAYPVGIFALFYNLTGVTTFQQVNLPGITDGLTQAAQLSQDALAILNGMQCATVGNLVQQLTDTNTQMNANAQVFTPLAPEIANAVQQIITQANPIEAEMNTTVGQVTDGMNQVEQQVNEISGQVESSLIQAMEMVYNIQNALDTAQHDIVTWSGYKPVQGGFRAIMTVPNTIALFFITVISIAVLYRIIMRNDPQNRSSPSRALGCFAVVGFYLLIFITWLAMAVASATFVGGWAISGVCVPMFQDNTFEAYGTLNGLSVNITGIDGTQTSVTTQQLLQSCFADKTIFSAINGNQILNANMIWNLINITQYETVIQDLVNQFGTSINIPTNQATLTAVNRLQTSMQQQASSYDVYQGNYKIDGCTPVDDKNKLTQLLNNLTTVLDNLNIQMTLLQTATIMSNSAATNITSVTQPMVDQTNQNIDQMNTMINGSLDALMTQLDTKSFQCYPLYQVFENAGGIMCDKFGRPVQGLWASAGLAALFFIPAAFALLYASTWLFKMKYGRRRSQLNADERTPTSSKKNKNAAAPAWDEDEMFAKPSLYDNTARTNQIAPVFAAPASRSDIYLERPSAPRQASSHGLPRASEAWGVDDDSNSGSRRLGQPQMSYDSGRPSGLTRSDDVPTSGWSSSSQLRRF